MPNPLALLFPLTAPPSVRYPCSLHFKDEEIDSERGSDWPKVTQLVSRIELQAVYDSSPSASSTASQTPA